MRIEISNAVAIRPGGIRALDGVACAFDSAESRAYALFGANGAGKSTLLGAILGLIPLNSGAISADGVAPSGKGLRELRRRIGMVFQNSDDQLFSQTAGEDVAFGPRNLRLDAPEIARRVSETLASLGIAHLAGRDVVRLSAGEKRRVALAGVLAMRPDAILLDEPTSMLDPRACRELAGILNGLPALKIIATHDLPFARRTCPRCLVLRAGALFFSGPTEEFLTRPGLLAEAGLE